jgi:hypothetical protein
MLDAPPTCSDAGNKQKMIKENKMELEKAKEFCDRWLPAWTGNRPELLISFYSDDAFYSDPYIPQGLKGKE